MPCGARGTGPTFSPRAARRQRRPIPQVEAAHGLVVEDAEGRFCGAVVGCDKATVTLEDRHGKRGVFPLTPAAFLTRDSR